MLPMFGRNSGSLGRGTVVDTGTAVTGPVSDGLNISPESDELMIEVVVFVPDIFKPRTAAVMAERGCNGA